MRSELRQKEPCSPIKGLHWPTTPRGTIDPQRLFRALANLGVRSDQNLSAFAPWRPSVTVKAPNRFGLNRRVSGDGQSAVPAEGPYLARCWKGT